MTFKIFNEALEYSQVEQILSPQLASVEVALATAVQDSQDEKTYAVQQALREDALGEFKDSHEILVALEALASQFMQSAKKGHLNSTSVGLMNLAVETFADQHQIDSLKKGIELDQYENLSEQVLSQALEGWQQTANELAQRMYDRLKSLSNMLAGSLMQFKNKTTQLEKELIELERMYTDKKASKVKEPRMLALHPEPWFVNLIVEGEAAPKGLVGIGNVLEEVLSNTSKTMLSAAQLYGQWMRNNHEKIATDPNAVHTLKYQRSHFQVMDESSFTPGRNIGWKQVHRDYEFRRSTQLPGGQALYTVVSKADLSGALVPGALQKTEVFIKDYDAISINHRKALITAAMAIPTAGFGVLAYNLLTTGNALRSGQLDRDEHGNAFGTQTKLTKDMLFQTLSLDEIGRVIAELKKGVDALRHYERVMTNEIWNFEGAIEAHDYLKARGKLFEEKGRRLLKDLAVGVFSLQVGATDSIPRYCIKTYRSMVRYAVKSLNQY